MMNNRLSGIWCDNVFYEEQPSARNAFGLENSEDCDYVDHKVGRGEKRQDFGPIGSKLKRKELTVQELSANGLTFSWVSDFINMDGSVVAGNTGGMVPVTPKNLYSDLTNSSARQAQPHFTKAQNSWTSPAPRPFTRAQNPSTSQAPLHFARTQNTSTRPAPLHFSGTQNTSTSQAPLHFARTQNPSTSQAPLHFARTQNTSTRPAPLHFSGTQNPSTRPNSLPLTEAQNLPTRPTSLPLTNGPNLSTSPTPLHFKKAQNLLINPTLLPLRKAQLSPTCPTPSPSTEAQTPSTDLASFLRNTTALHPRQCLKPPYKSVEDDIKEFAERFGIVGKLRPGALNRPRKGKYFKPFN